MPRKAHMLETLKRLTGTDHISRSQRAYRRNYQQNQKILLDFPWLWAVSTEWCMVDWVMAVRDEDPPYFFAQKIDRKLLERDDDPVCGLWIHAVRNNRLGRPEFVEKIWSEPTSCESLQPFEGENWSNRLMTHIHRSVSSPTEAIIILHFAVTYWHSEAITIYRPKKPAWNFNFAISSFGVGEL
jgi:hypothetical protein